eukprot:gene384-6798_t
MQKVLERTKNLINVLYPNREKKYVDVNINTTENDFILCLNFVGNTYHLNIKNSISNLKQFESNEYLQKSLLNANNDVIDLVKFLILKNKSMSEYEICSQVTKNYLENSILSNISKKKSLIIYFSGHGTNKNNEFYFNFAKSSNSNSTEFYSINNLIENTKYLSKNRLFIIDSCYSGLSSKFGKNQQNEKIFFLCSSNKDEHSGGWIMDGSDSGGIMTKCLIDPIGTFFKINFKIFFDWDNKFKNDLTKIYHFYALKMIKSSKNGDINLEILKNIGNHWLVLYLNFLILIKYGDELLNKQTPISYPDLSETKNSKYWIQFEEELESELMLKIQSKA